MIILIEDQEGQKFGGYISSTINKYNEWIEDPNAFVLSLKSNRILFQPMKFIIKDQSKAFLFNNSDKEKFLFLIGRSNYGCDIAIYKQNNCKQQSYCENNNFNYENIKNALRGTNDYFTPKRLIVIQMN